MSANNVAGERPGAEVIIVGGGVTGLSAAWWLAKAGVDVLVLKSGLVGWEASGRNGGGCSHHHSPLFAEEQRLWPMMDEMLGCPTEFQSNRIRIALNETQFKLYSRAVENARRQGFSVDELDAAEVRKLVPMAGETAFAGHYYRFGGHANPHRTVQAFAWATQDQGGVISQHTTVRKLQKTGDRIKAVETDRGVFGCDHVVIAAGAQTARLAASLGIHLPLRAARAEMIVTEPVPLMPIGGIDGNGIYGRQTLRGNLAYGGGPHEWLDTEEMPGAARPSTPLMRNISARLFELLPGGGPLQGHSQLGRTDREHARRQAGDRPHPSAGQPDPRHDVGRRLRSLSGRGSRDPGTRHRRRMQFRRPFEPQTLAFRPTGIRLGRTSGLGTGSVLHGAGVVTVFDPIAPCGFAADDLSTDVPAGTDNSTGGRLPIRFIHDLRFDDLPTGVVGRSKQALLDLIGVAVAGTQTELSRIARCYAANNLCRPSGGATILFDGRLVSPAGADYAGASTIDAFDAHDGHRLTKGHAGVALLMALMALIDDGGAVDGREFLVNLALGYEIATQAGIALHDSVADYHTSGAWNAVGVAAMGARLGHLDAQATRHALGIAEYHGPRSQMMRCIDHPTMLKDGSGWGALAGVSAVALARDGFTGAPAATFEGTDHRALWDSLGKRWMIEEHYFKPYPVCRWAQPAVEAVAGLVEAHGIQPESIAKVEIETFTVAVRLGTRFPSTTEEAQYALDFPVAAFLTYGGLDAAAIGDKGLGDPATASMLKRITLVENGQMTARFPSERVARARLTLSNGTSQSSEIVTARGDPEHPLAGDLLLSKFRDLAQDLGPDRPRQIEMAVARLGEEGTPTAQLFDLLLSPISA